MNSRGNESAGGHRKMEMTLSAQPPPGWRWEKRVWVELGVGLGVGVRFSGAAYPLEVSVPKADIRAAGAAPT